MISARPAEAIRDGHREHDLSWAAARAVAAELPPSEPVELRLADAVGTVLAADATAPHPVPHYDSSAMDGWAVAGAPPWRLASAADARTLIAGGAVPVVTGGLLPAGCDAVVPLERGRVVGDRLEAEAPEHGAHIRLAGEEATAGTVLVPAGTRLSPAHLAVLAIAGTDAVRVRPRPRIGFVLTGDEVDTSGVPGPGRVRDAFDPLLPLAASRLGADALSPIRAGDDPAAIRSAIATLRDADVLVTVGGTGRSRVDRLREAIDGATIRFDGVAMRPGHPTLLTALPDGRPLLGLPGNPLAAVAAMLSFVPPLVGARTASAPGPDLVTTASVTLPGWRGGTQLVPCRTTPDGVAPAPAARPNMLRGLAASDVLAVVPAEGVEAGGRVQVLPLPW